MNIAIIHNDSYPVGKALTNRIHYYAKGLNESGFNTKIIIHRPTENDDSSVKNVESKGVYKSVQFEYPAKTTIRASSFVKRRLNDFLGISKTGFILWQNRRTLSAVLLVSGCLTHIVFYRMITKIIKVPLLLEKSELPFIYKEKTFYLKLYSKLYIKYVYRLFEGILVISENLREYFLDKIGNNCKLFTIPILVDCSDFRVNNYEVSNGFNLVYTGSLCQKKDGVLTLIKAFSIVQESFSDCMLYIVGDTSNADDKKKLYDLINELKLQNCIKLKGYVDRSIFVTLLSDAQLLVLAKPSSDEANYCFPSKIGEYLATGKPVLTTSLGSIPIYLSDWINGFLVDPDDEYKFAQKIKEIIVNYRLAQTVGEKGRELALKNFDYRKNTNRLALFINSLIPVKRRKTKCIKQLTFIE